MNDKKLVIIGLFIFIVVFMLFPVWYNHFKAAPAPKLELTAKAKAAKTCIYPTEFMKSEHMQVLDEWRYQVVRKGNRIVKIGDKEYTMSLSNTCLDCHSNKEQFCDKCHNYASVEPYCWDCHFNPKEKK